MGAAAVLLGLLAFRVLPNFTLASERGSKTVELSSTTRAAGR